MTDPVLGPTEVWDTDALTELEEACLAQSGTGARIPRPFRCRTGAVPGTKGTSKKVLSFYLRPDKTEDGVGQLYISPLVGDSAVAIRLLAKMAVESIYPDDPKNQAWFARVYFGIEWNTRLPVPIDAAGEETRQAIPDIIAALGPRPHGAVVLPEQVRTPKTTALLKAYCPYCSVPVRATLSALKEAWPVCVGNGRHSPVYFHAKANTGETLFACDQFACNRDARNNPCP